MTILPALYGYCDTQHNDIQHNDTQHKGLNCNTRQKVLICDTQHTLYQVPLC